MSSLLRSLTKGILYLLQSFQSLVLLFGYFVEFPSLLTMPICSCTLSTLPIRTLNIFIIVVLNSQSNNSKVETAKLLTCYIRTLCALFYWVTYISIVDYESSLFPYLTYDLQIFSAILWAVSLLSCGMPLQHKKRFLF